MWKMRKDRRGLTLIELVCAVAILGIISATIGGAMVVATNSYRNGTVEAALQQEAQFTINTIESLIIDATDTVEYEGNVLTIANVDYTYKIYYNLDDQTLTYQQIDNATGEVIGDPDEPYLLAEHVLHFEADTSRFEATRNVGLTLTLENEGRSFTTAYNITSRNNPDAGVPLEMVASILVESEIILEPNECKLLPVTVTGSPGITLNVYADDPDHTMSTENKFEYKPSEGGVEITIAESETGGADGWFLLHLEARSVTGEILDTAEVTVRIRRVLTFSWSNFTPVSGTPYKAGAVYSITATPAGTNLAKQVPVPWYDLDYVDPYSLKWSIETVGGDGSSYATIISPTDPTDIYSNEVRFQLTKDMTSGMIIRVTADAQHPQGVNKCAPRTYDVVKESKDLVYVANPFNIDDSDLRRGDDRWVETTLNPKDLVEDEWRRMHPGEALPNPGPYNAGFTGWVFYRYSNDSGTSQSNGFPGWIKFTEQGDARFKFNAADFQDMLYMESYNIELLYSFKYNGPDNVQRFYPESAFPSGDQPITNVDPQYIYTFRMNAFSMGFDSYQDADGGKSTSPYLEANGTGLGTYNRPMEVTYCNDVYLSFDIFTGASAAKGGALEDILSHARLYRDNNGTWVSNSLEIQYTERQDEPQPHGKIRLGLQNAGIQKNVVYKLVFESVKGETYFEEPKDNNAGARGVIFMIFR